MNKQPDFDTLADAYETYRTGYGSSLYDTILEAAPTDPAVLDVAAGTGLSTQGLLAHARRLIPVDVARGMLVQAPITNRVLAQAEALPFAEETFELVACAQAFHWLDPEPAYRELHRVLAPNGLAAIWWKYPTEDDPARQATDEAFEQVTGRVAPHTPFVTGPLPMEDKAPFSIETIDIPMVVEYTHEEYLGYQASRAILRREAAEQRERVLAQMQRALAERLPADPFEMDYNQHLHLLVPE